MLAYFHVPGKTPRLSEDLKIWTRSSVIKSPYNWIMQIEIYSNALAFVGFNDLIIEVISSLLRKTLFNHISVFTNNEGSLQLIFKGSKKFIKNICCLCNIWNYFTSYKNPR